MGFMKIEEVANMGFAHIGKDPLLSDKASFHNCKNIIIGDNVRIDDFCVLSAGKGGIKLGNNIHIAVYSSLIGTETISLADYSNISSRVSIYSSSDDYSGDFMTNPTIPDTFTNVDSRPVIIGKHVIVGCGCVILPGVTLEEGVAVGALSLVKKDCKAYNIYAGNPLKKIKKRNQDVKNLESLLLT